MTDIAALEARIARLEDIEEIRNLMGRRAYLHSAGLNGRSSRSAGRVETTSHSKPRTGASGTARKASSRPTSTTTRSPTGLPGLLIEHTLTTEVLEIAGDRQTAKGVWISPGHETFPIVDGELPKAHWSWGRYAMDFVREDGQWKIWHLHVLTTFRTPFGQDWVDSAVNRPPYFPETGTVMDGMTPPTRPVTFNQPYHPDLPPAYQPVPPQPYETWADTTSCTDPLPERV